MGLGHPVAANDHAGAAWSEHKSEDRIMSHTKETGKRKHLIKTMPMLGAAGLSFSLTIGTSAAIGRGIRIRPPWRGRALGGLWSASARAGQTSISSEPTSGQRTSLSSTATVQISVATSGAQIQAPVIVHRVTRATAGDERCIAVTSKLIRLSAGRGWRRRRRLSVVCSQCPKSRRCSAN